MKLYVSYPALLLAVLALTACATAKQIYTSDGGRGYSINCSGSLLNWGSCIEKAEKTCGAEGYEVVEKTGEEGLTVTSDHSTLQRGSIVHRSMVIRCNEE